MNKGTAYEAPPFVKDLLTIDDFCEMVSQFSIRVCFLVGQWMASHQEYMDSINLSQRVNKFKKKEGIELRV